MVGSPSAQAVAVVNDGFSYIDTGYPFNTVQLMSWCKSHATSTSPFLANPLYLVEPDRHMYKTAPEMALKLFFTSVVLTV
ncbi:hypothetical protein GBAR_LOCUS1686 [Geodia barretti]|nr:hypothetical protein GBAR_LOCUS1686 [Geodia barretti]CAI7995422.1 hypothetical protein GBAR_LOCUS1686 [Geodia barretti]